MRCEERWKVHYFLFSLSKMWNVGGVRDIGWMTARRVHDSNILWISSLVLIGVNFPLKTFKSREETFQTTRFLFEDHPNWKEFSSFPACKKSAKKIPNLPRTPENIIIAELLDGPKALYKILFSSAGLLMERSIIHKIGLNISQLDSVPLGWI